MKKLSPNSPCPCGSKNKYKKCCQIYHKGALPKTALLLMKSRYMAYVVGDSSYIMKTTHPNNSDYTNEVKEWKESMKGMLVFSLFIFVLNYLFTTEQQRLVYASVMTLRFLDVISFFSLFFLTTSPDDFADSLIKLKIPYEYVLMFQKSLLYQIDYHENLLHIYLLEKNLFFPFGCI